MTKQDNHATAAVASIEDATGCGARADGLVSAVLGRVMRQRRSTGVALDYVRALSRDTRANCWELAEAAGHEGPHRMQALLRTYKWSWEKLRAALPALAAACLPDDPGDPTGPGIAVDETADLRKGSATACVAPQHAGVTGKVENCVTWVFAALVTALGQAWADFDVYMPDAWARDPERREKAGIPDGLVFKTKPELAIAQVRRLAAAGLRFCWVAADEVYGRSREFRDACRTLSLAYVVIIPCDYRVTIAKDKVIRADQAVPGAVFERRSCGNGTKGPRYGDWAMIATADPREFLLIRRLDREKNQYTFYLCWSPGGRPATVTYFITIAGRRWPVEVTFRTGKDTLGWDQSQIRTYDGICRHTALTAIAQLRAAAVRAAMTGALALPDAPAVSTATAVQDTACASDLQIYPYGAPLPVTGGLPCPPGIPPIGLSAAEAARIERLTRNYAAGLLSRARLAFHLRWSHWRRRHQARARWHHYSTRLQALAT
ncbi:MAG: IS701 family transposase [Streptosporangiales bacterium]